MDTWLKRIGLGVLVLAILGAVAVFAIDAHVQTTAGPRIVTADEAAVLGNVDCVLVLGCGVHPDGCRVTCWRTASPRASRCTRTARRRSC